MPRITINSAVPLALPRGYQRNACAVLHSSTKRAYGEACLYLHTLPEFGHGLRLSSVAWHEAIIAIQACLKFTSATRARVHMSRSLRCPKRLPSQR